MLWGSFVESLKLYVHLKCTLGSVYLWSDQKWWNRSLLHMQLERTSSDQRSWVHYKCDVQNECDNFYEPHLYLVVLFTCNRIARNWCYNAKKLRLNIHPNSNTEIFSKMPNKNIKPCQKKPTYIANTNPKTLLACSSPCVDTVYTSGSQFGQELEERIYFSFTVQSYTLCWIIQ